MCTTHGHVDMLWRLPMSQLWANSNHHLVVLSSLAKAPFSTLYGRQTMGTAPIFRPPTAVYETPNRLDLSLLLYHQSHINESVGSSATASNRCNTFACSSNGSQMYEASNRIGRRPDYQGPRPPNIAFFGVEQFTRKQNDQFPVPIRWTKNRTNLVANGKRRAMGVERGFLLPSRFIFF